MNYFYLILLNFKNLHLFKLVFLINFHVSDTSYFFPDSKMADNIPVEDGSEDGSVVEDGSVHEEEEIEDSDDEVAEVVKFVPTRMEREILQTIREPYETKLSEMKEQVDKDLRALKRKHEYDLKDMDQRHHHALQYRTWNHHRLSQHKTSHLLHFADYPLMQENMDTTIIAINKFIHTINKVTTWSQLHVCVNILCTTEKKASGHNVGNL